MFARSCGAQGYRVTEPRLLRETIATALAAPGPVVVDVQVDPTEIRAPLIRRMSLASQHRQPQRHQSLEERHGFGTTVLLRQILRQPIADIASQPADAAAVETLFSRKLAKYGDAEQPPSWPALKPRDVVSAQALLPDMEAIVCTELQTMSVMRAFRAIGAEVNRASVDLLVSERIVRTPLYRRHPMYVWKSLILGSALALIAPLALAGHHVKDTSIGTWKLNLAKSAFGSKTLPKGQTRIYTATRNGTHVVIEDEAADGRKTTTEITITYDGKVHPAAGNPDWDSAAATRVDPYETKAQLYRGGKPVGSLRRLVAEDGKTMVMNVVVTKADGTTETALSVFDRQ